MGKLIHRLSIVIGLLLSVPALSVTGISCASSTVCMSTPLTNSGGNLGAFYPPGFVLGGGMGGGPSAADLAAKEKAAQDGKKKYCKDNGYPSNVPFCAAFKEEEKKACQVVARATKILCQKDYNQHYTNELISCGRLFLSDNLLSQCNKAAESQLATDLLSCDLSFELSISKC